MTWPDYFPDGCPPQDAVAASGTAYRLCLKRAVGGIARAKEFRPHKLFPDPTTGKAECHRCDVSLDDDLQNLLKLRQTVADKVGRHYLKRVPAVGDLQPEWGAMKLTPSDDSPTHRSLWLYDGVNPHESFTVVAEPEVPDED